MSDRWKVLNLYAGIGGNRKLWKDVNVTTVEWDKKIAKIYQDFFPNDKLIVTNAHEYLLKHFKEFDFIWSSPPCPTHSKIRKCYYNQNPPIYPDMKLYEEILLLMGYFKGLWVVENVKSWYNPLIKPYNIGNHYFWANFYISKKDFEGRKHYGTINELQKRKGFDISNYNVDKIKTLRNCVEPELGLHIFNCAKKQKQRTLNEIIGGE